MTATEDQLPQLSPVAEQHRRQNGQVHSTAGHDQGLGPGRQMKLGGREYDVGTVGGSQWQRGNHGLGDVAGTVRGAARRHPVIRGGSCSVSHKNSRQAGQHYNTIPTDECQLPVLDHYHVRQLAFTTGTASCQVLQLMLHSDQLVIFDTAAAQ